MLDLGIALGARNPAQWWPEGALYAADFGENRYMAGGAPIAANAAFTLTRASGKRAADSRGNWLAFGANQRAQNRARRRAGLGRLRDHSHADTCRDAAEDRMRLRDVLNG